MLTGDSPPNSPFYCLKVFGGGRPPHKSFPQKERPLEFAPKVTRERASPKVQNFFLGGKTVVVIRCRLCSGHLRKNKFASPLLSLRKREERGGGGGGGGASNLCSFSLKVREMRRRRRTKRGIPPPPRPPLWVIASFVVRSTRRRRKRKRRRRGSLGQRKCQEEEGLSSLSVFLFSLVGMDTSPNRFAALAHTHNAFLNFPREKKKKGGNVTLVHVFPRFISPFPDIHGKSILARRLLPPLR